MAKLIDVMVSALGFMGKLSSGTISSVGTNIFIDTSMVANSGDYTGGTVFFPGDTHVDGASSHTVTDYLPDTKVFRYLPTRTTAGVLAGQPYAITPIGRNALVNAVNSALLAMGEYTAFTDVTITSDAAGTFELPANVRNVKRVQVNNSSLLIDYPNLGMLRRYQFHNWREAKIGTKYGLVFDGVQVINTPVTFRIWHGSPHPRVILDTDEIHPDYHAERLAYETAYWAYFQYLAQDNNANDKNTLLFQTIIEMKRNLANRYPVPQIYKDPILPRN